MHAINVASVNDAMIRKIEIQSESGAKRGSDGHLSRRFFPWIHPRHPFDLDTNTLHTIHHPSSQEYARPSPSPRSHRRTPLAPVTKQGICLDDQPLLPPVIQRLVQLPRPFSTCSALSPWRTTYIHLPTHPPCPLHPPHPTHPHLLHRKRKSSNWTPCQCCSLMNGSCTHTRRHRCHRHHHDDRDNLHPWPLRLAQAGRVYTACKADKADLLDRIGGRGGMILETHIMG